MAQPNANGPLSLERYRAPLRNYFRKRVGHEGEVDDLVQEVFYRLLRQDETKIIDNPEGYIFQAASNLLRDRARRAATRTGFQRDFAAESEKKYEEISPERVLIARQELKSIRQALEQLPSRTLAVFVMHRFEGFKYREIADRLKISSSSVEKHMMTAIRHLKKHIGKGDLE